MVDGWLTRRTDRRNTAMNNSRLLEGHRHGSIFEAMPTFEVVTAIRDGQLTGQTASRGKFHMIFIHA